MLNIVIFGPPGAGKGTQSQLLIDQFNLIHLSTGDILRGEIAQGTELGIKAKSIMDRGDLVPDEVVIGMIRSILEKNPNAKGFIFDGFPRTTVQAESLDQMLNELNTSISTMLSLDVDVDELTKRLLERGKSSGRADDANESIIRNRIKEYNKKTAPLKKFYAKQNKLQSITGVGSVDSIYTKICEAIDQIK
ncbi:MAG: adenylate kinase [Flavobacteriales bacterium]|nr:adenylate kinase [Flavobacteriales bacterium]|tara:strand:+ start:641 stop:1216 length:576 start_codon:yes stop_codon:yes gene_type:complete